MWQGNQSKNDSFGSTAGGFVKGESPSGSQGQGTSSKTKKSDNVLPVTVAYIHHCLQNYERVKIANVDIAAVKIVGLVRSINQGASHVTYEIDDHTGKPITVKHWQDSSSVERFMPVENTYVVIIGNVKTFQNKSTITALKVRPLQNLNELTAHIIEVMHAKISLERGLNVEMAIEAGSSHLSSTAAFGSGVKANLAANDDSANPHGLNLQQLKVYNLIKSNTSEAGCSTDAICKQLNNQSRDSIKKIIEFMSGEGHIYSTVDEDHFKTTDC